MNHLRLENNSTSTESVGYKVIEAMYEEASSGTLDSSSNMKGYLTCTHAFEDAVDFLLNKYSDLHITVSDGKYIRFADDAVGTICANSYGDGSGLTVAKATALTSLGDSFKENTDIVSFDELSRFTSITTLTNQAFYNCTSLKSINLTNITQIWQGQFSGCTSLTGDISLPNLTSTGGVNSSNYAFKNTAITSVSDLGTTITAIYNNWDVGGMFSNCPKITLFNMPSTVTYLGHCTLNIDGSDNNVSENLLTKIDISNITYFGSFCFQFRSNITDWGAGEGVMNLNENITYIGFRAFHMCSGMTGDLNLPNLETLGKNSFGNCNLTSISNLGKITELASDWSTSGTFANNVNLNTVVLPSTCTSIGSYAFYGDTSLSTINLSNVTTINNSSFQNCTGLTTISLPLSLSTLNVNNFNDCNNVTTLNNLSEFISNIEYIYDNTFIDLVNIDFGDLVFPKLKILKSSFNASRTSYNAGKYIKVNSVSAPLCTKFQGFQFSNIVSLDLPECTEFDIGCGYWSTTLTSISFPKLQILGQQALEVCTSLTSLTLPSSLTSIGRNALASTKNIKWVVIEATTPPSIDGSNFGNSWNYYVPDDSLDTYKATGNWASHTDKIFNMTQFNIDFPDA